MTAEQAKELVRLVFGEEAAEDNDIVTFYKEVNEHAINDNYITREQHEKDVIEARNDMQKKCVTLANNVLIKTGKPAVFQFNENEAKDYYQTKFKS